MLRCRLPFARSQEGSTAVVFALSLLPVMMFVGIAVDYGRARTDHASFQSVMDAAVLAGAAMNLPDEKRVERARVAFTSLLKPMLAAQVQSTSFTMDEAKTTVVGSAVTLTPTLFSGFHGRLQFAEQVRSSSLIARPQVRQLDLVMCIDGTGSMSDTINAVKANALNFEANLNAELKRRGLPAFDAMRVRPIVYRDFGGNSWYDPASAGWAYTPSGWIWVSSSDPNRGKYVGDVPPMDVADFFKLPDQRSGFAAFVQAESAWGGGDEPEAGLECVNEAMNSPFAKVGDVLASGKALTAVHPVIAVWTDANAHPPAFAKSLQNPLYPSASVMPRSHAGLLAKWNDPARVDRTNRLLVFFGGPSTTGTSADPQGWAPLKDWPGYYAGGTLSDGNAQMVAKIVDAISSKISQPVITQ